MGVKGGRWGRSGLPIREGDKRKREVHLLSPLEGGDRGGKTVSPIRGGIKVGDEKRGLGGFSLVGEGKSV